MASDFNQKLQNSVQATPGATNESQAPRVSWSIVGLDVPGGGGAALALQF